MVRSSGHRNARRASSSPVPRCPRRLRAEVVAARERHRRAPRAVRAEVAQAHHALQVVLQFLLDHRRAGRRGHHRRQDARRRRRRLRRRPTCRSPRARSSPRRSRRSRFRTTRKRTSASGIVSCASGRLVSTSVSPALHLRGDGGADAARARHGDGRLALRVPRSEICAEREQHVHAPRVAPLARHVQRRVPVRVRARHVHARRVTGVLARIRNARERLDRLQMSPARRAAAPPTGTTLSWRGKHRGHEPSASARTVAASPAAAAATSAARYAPLSRRAASLDGGIGPRARADEGNFATRDEKKRRNDFVRAAECIF